MGFGYPCLYPDSSDYQSIYRYSAALQQIGPRLSVLHQLTNVHCLPAQWLKSRHAALTCEVRVPYMLYCHRYDHDLPDQTWPAEGEMRCRQDMEFPGTLDRRTAFIPAIVLRTEQRIVLDAARHGVSDQWHGKTVIFPKGAVLAKGSGAIKAESVTRLLKFQLGDASDDPGVVRSFVQEAGDQWNFVVKVHAGKLAAMEDGQHTDWSNAFHISCLAQMLNAIRENFRRQKPPHEALLVLANLIRDLTGKAPPWETGTATDEWRDTLHIAARLCRLHTPGQGPVPWDRRIKQARQALNPQGLTHDPLTALRDQLVSTGQAQRGGTEQMEFLQAVEANVLLDYLADKGVGHDFTVLTLPALPYKLQESEFVAASVAIAQETRNTYRDLTPQEASSVSVWNAITLYNIQAGQLEAPYLAASSQKVSGYDRLQNALKQGSPKQIDDCVRTVFRRMGGLRRIRGNVSVFSDCTLSRYWWMARMWEETVRRTRLDEARTWYALSRHWTGLSSWAVRRLPMVAHPVLIAGFISYLLDNSPEATTQEVEDLLGQAKQLFREVSPYTWTVSEFKERLLSTNDHA